MKATVAEIVNEWFQGLPTPELQQMARHTLIANLEYRANEPLYELRVEFAEVNADGASSNDVVQWLDDYLTARGLPTVLYGGSP